MNYPVWLCGLVVWWCGAFVLNLTQVSFTEREMARGKTRGHKGGRKQFSNPDQIKDDMAKEEEKRLWREQHPDSESEESSEEEQAKAKECFYNSLSS